jgi:hypothetical protein
MIRVSHRRITENLIGGKAIKELGNAKGARLVLGPSRPDLQGRYHRGAAAEGRLRPRDQSTPDLARFRRTGTSSWLFAVSFLLLL